MKIDILPFLSVVLVAGALSAQQPDIAPSYFQDRPCSLDSGWVDNPHEAVRTVFRGEVQIDGANRLRLFFEDTNLPAGSRLHLTSAHDGHDQWFDAHSLRDYEYGSAIFNGDRVVVELIAAPGSRANRVHVPTVSAEILPAAFPDTICGNVDNRTLSSDPRACRFNGGCTGWLINEFTVVSAGHCFGGGRSFLLEFNVPLSTTSGSKISPPPDDQYSCPSTSAQSLASGIGKDWGVCTAVRNSNTGLYPGQAQGSWFDLVAPTVSITGNIRITGYGTVSSPVSATWNQVQKTHLGPRITTRYANAVRYRTDTSGGNSGSPVIYETTGKAVGVHTHGGCTSTGGGNYGTAFNRVDFSNSVAGALGSKVVGQASLFGSACPSSTGLPSMSVSGIPDLGNGFSVVVTNLPASTLGTMILGADKSSWSGQSLPLVLDPYGITGCSLYVRPDITNLKLSSFFGTASESFTLPTTSTSLVGTSNYFQYMTFDAASPNGKAGMSEAVEVVIGSP